MTSTIKKAKVLVYIVNNGHLLVNLHTDFLVAGIQVPGGTIEPGESAKTASIRELYEESRSITTCSPERIRTADFQLRRLTFYPAELRDRASNLGN